MAEGENKLKELILNNWEIKLLALFMGTLTFYAARNVTSFEVFYHIPVEVKVEKGIAILEQDPRDVEVTFRGSQDDLRQLGSASLRAVVEPKASDPTGSEKVEIDGSNIRGARGIRVVDIRPREVSLTFDRESEKKVSVAAPTLIGKPLIGKVQIDYEPKTATLRGPIRRLEEKTVLDTQPIDVNDRVQSFSTKAKILPPGDLPGVTIEPAEVEAKITIVTESVSREWTNVLVSAMYRPGFPAKITFEPDRVNVLLNGREDLIRRIADNAVVAFVDCSNLKENSSNVMPVSVHFPQAAGLNATITPEKVKVTVSEVFRSDAETEAPAGGGR